MLIVKELKKIIKGILVQGVMPASVSGVSIDSRTAQKGNIFIAIEGERFNGHAFIRAAIRKGAKVVVVSKKVSCPRNISVLLVKDTTKALGQIAAWHRYQFDIPVIAITGSTGKTTTKDMLAAVLMTRFKVLKNVKTENNQFGVPLTLLKLNATHQMAILELGTSQPGDIRLLARMVQPTTILMTNIGESHLAGLKNKKGVYAEKVQLIRSLKPGGHVIVNGDDPYLITVPKGGKNYKKISFGFSQGLKVVISLLKILLYIITGASNFRSKTIFSS